VRLFQGEFEAGCLVVEVVEDGVGEPAVCEMFGGVGQDPLQFTDVVE
jgi:hypothetical protein